MVTMLVSIDRAGRVVIPKELRDRLAIGPDSELEVSVDADGIRLTPQRPPARMVVDDDGWPVLQRVTGITVTDADVHRWRDAEQR